MGAIKVNPLRWILRSNVSIDNMLIIAKHILKEGKNGNKKWS